jgi:hypothetical protein
LIGIIDSQAEYISFFKVEYSPYSVAIGIPDIPGIPGKRPTQQSFP